MELIFAGCGSAFTDSEHYQNNAVIRRGERLLLIDCGGDARFSLPEALGGRDPISAIDAVYISHLHADHIGGLEWLAFCTYFNPNLGRPKLVIAEDLIEPLWEHSLRGGLQSIQGKEMTLSDYFECIPVAPNDAFEWEFIHCQPVQTVHVMSGYRIVHSYGLLFQDRDDPRPDAPPCPKVFYTSDTQFCPNQIQDFYDEADLIFQDCETSAFKSGVHAHYDDLKTLPEETRRKMWLMHYQSTYAKVGGSRVSLSQKGMQKDAVEAGFAGFVHKGQVFGLGVDTRTDEE